MPITPIRPAQFSIEQRRGQVERQMSIQDDIVKLSYFLTFSGAGEASVQLNFPCKFIDIPLCTSGFSMDSAATLEDGNFPWASAGIILEPEEIANRTYYVGGTLLVVMGGSRNQKMVVHWSAEGKAIVGPTS